LVEIPLLSPFGVLFMNPILQPKANAVNIKGDIDFRHTAMAVSE
jgi:hypothetical protein